MANPKKVIKAVSRAVGGITGKGAKHVNPIYKVATRSQVDEWGGEVSAARRKYIADTAARRAAEKKASEEAAKKIAAREKRVKDWADSPEGKKAIAKRDADEREKFRGPTYVEGETGRGGWTKTVGKNPIRRHEG